MKIVTILLLLLLAGCNNDDTNRNIAEPDNPVATPIINYSMVRSYPHDTTSYTEGLLVHEGQIFESTGSPGNLPQTRSLFGVLDTVTGKINVKGELDKTKYFGEGIVFLNGKFYQLTYQTKIGFIYDAKTFKQLGQFTFPGLEGWGMTTDSTALIMSDGTNRLYFFDPLTFKILKTVQVENDKGTVLKINELEYINKYIYANVYETSTILKIDPTTGKTIGVLDLSSLANEAKSRYPGAMEMNGIAYDPVYDKVYVSGKMWPVLYHIQFTH